MQLAILSVLRLALVQVDVSASVNAIDLSALEMIENMVRSLSFRAKRSLYD